MLSLKYHNLADYAFAVLLLFLPMLLGFDEILAARNFFLLAGLSLLTYSLLTNYQFSAWRGIPLGAHMTFDLAIGLALLAAPLALGYRNLLSGRQELAHYIMGFVFFAFVGLTRSHTESEKKRREPMLTDRIFAAGRKGTIKSLDAARELRKSS